MSDKRRYVLNHATSDQFLFLHVVFLLFEEYHETLYMQLLDYNEYYCF